MIGGDVDDVGELWRRLRILFVNVEDVEIVVVSGEEDDDDDLLFNIIIVPDADLVDLTIYPVVLRQ